MANSHCSPGDNESFTIGLLDFGVVPSARSVEACLADTVSLVQRAELLGFSRYWLAEHYATNGAWTSPTPMLALLTAETDKIRLGAAGILLAHYPPFAVANDFALLAAVSAGRIDLGMVSATVQTPVPITQPPPDWSPVAFAERVKTIAGFYDTRQSPQVSKMDDRVIPGANHRPALWVLGSSESSARLAGTVSAGYGTTLFLNAPSAGPSIAAYAPSFRGTKQMSRPHSVVAVAGICADTPANAQLLLKQHINPWVRPNVVGTVEDCAALFRRALRITKANEIVFLDLAQDPDARQATCTMLASLLPVKTVTEFDRPT